VPKNPQSQGWKIAEQSFRKQYRSHEQVRFAWSYTFISFAEKASNLATKLNCPQSEKEYIIENPHDIIAQHG
jgi:hypothetical protein